MDVGSRLHDACPEWTFHSCVQGQLPLWLLESHGERRVTCYVWDVRVHVDGRRIRSVGWGDHGGKRASSTACHVIASMQLLTPPSLGSVACPPTVFPLFSLASRDRTHKSPEATGELKGHASKEQVPEVQVQ